MNTKGGNGEARAWVQGVIALLVTIDVVIDAIVHLLRGSLR